VGKTRPGMTIDMVGARGFEPPATCTPCRFSSSRYLTLLYIIFTSLLRLELARILANNPLFSRKTGYGFRRPRDAINETCTLKPLHDGSNEYTDKAFAALNWFID
jgi:hypothetical protein